MIWYGFAVEVPILKAQSIRFLFPNAAETVSESGFAGRKPHEKTIS
jgi:hypothetical protein